MSNQVQKAFEILIGKLIQHEHAALDCALEVAAVREALQHSGEPVGWQFYDNGKWFNGMPGDHRAYTEAAGIPVRDLYTTPQPVVERKCSECGNGEPGLSLYCVRCLNNDGWHLDENWTPQPVVPEGSDAFLADVQAAIKTGDLVKADMLIQGFRVALLSAGRGGES
jgi:hypothetical protein